MKNHLQAHPAYWTLAIKWTSSGGRSLQRSNTGTSRKLQRHICSL